MSLLNKVLKQIEEKRQKYMTRTEHQSSHGATGKPSTGWKMMLARILLWSLFFIMLLVLAYIFFMQKRLSALHEASKVQPKSTPIEQIKKIAQEPKLKSITWHKISDNQARLTIRLNQSVHFALKSEDESVILTLDGVQPPEKIDLPKLEQSKIATDIKMRAQNDDATDLVLQVKPKVKVHSVEHETGDEALVQVDFSVPSAPAKAKEQDQEIKKVVLTPAQKLEKSYQQAVAAANNHKLTKAQELLEQLHKHHPKVEKVQLALARVYLEQGKYPRADSLTSALLKQNQHSIPAALMQARSLLAQKKTAAALQLLHNYGPSMQGHEDFYNVLAATELLNQNYSQAAGYYMQLLELNPNKSNWWLGYAICQQSLGQKHAATTAYNKALSTGQLTPPLKVYVHNQLAKLKGQR